MSQLSKQISNKYIYRVMWSEEDGEFVGLCSELPSLSWLDKSRVKALEGIVKLAQDTVVEMVENGDKPPLPLTDKKYSGIFKVRIPGVVHRSLAIEAAEAGVSINRLVSAKLARGGG